MKAVIEKVKYTNNYENTFWVLETLTTHVHYKLKFSGKVSEQKKYWQMLKDFCKQEQCEYKWIQDVYEEQEKAIERKDINKALYYDHNFVYWCTSYDSYLSEEYSCFCQFLEDFLNKHWFEWKLRTGKEDFSVLK